MGLRIQKTVPDVGADLPVLDDERYILAFLYEASWQLTCLLSGFDTSLMGSINALPNYTRYYNLPESGSVSTGIVFAIFQVCTQAQEERMVLTVKDWPNGWGSLHLGSRLAWTAISHLHWRHRRLCWDNCY